MPSQKKRVVSGIRTSGELHLGNYLGALQQFITLQDDYESFFFLADLHALTTPYDPKTYADQVRGVANVYLACGLDPDKAVLFRQSELSAHSELAWLLETTATMGELSRMTQFKEKSQGQQNDSINAGLFNYPVLMAADILLYQPQAVPVGDDQKQHVEITRDLAERFNNKFGKTFTVPEPLIQKAGARIKGLDDPAKKMSKSASSEYNYIALADSPDVIRKKISKAVTDSGDQVKSGSNKPALTNLLTIYSLLEGISVAEIEQRYAGSGYGDFKKELADVIVATLEPIQAKLKELESDPQHVESVLEKGAERARPLAEETLRAAQAAMGLR